MTLLYKYKETVTTKIDVDYREQTVSITNFTDDLFYRAFGVNEHPTFSDYEQFLEDRCFPKTRDKMKLHLRELGIDFYEPLTIIKKTGGRLAGDFMSLEIINDKEEDIAVTI